MSRAYVLTIPDELDQLIRCAMIDEGIEPTREHIHRWMIGALVFTSAACSDAGYQAICDAYGVTQDHTRTGTDSTTPAPPRGKVPPSG